MRHIISLGLLFLFLGFNISVYAAAGRYANGTVTDASAKPITGASLTITCLGNILTATSGADGTYSVQFDKLSHCLKGSSVTIKAEKNGAIMSTTKKMGDSSITIDIALPIESTLPEPVAVPEFGPLAGLVATTVSGLLFFRTKNNYSFFAKKNRQ